MLRGTLLHCFVASRKTSHVEYAALAVLEGATQWQN